MKIVEIDIVTWIFFIVFITCIGIGELFFMDSENLCELPLTPQLIAILEGEAPETLIEPDRERFVDDEDGNHYRVALEKFRRCNHWATPCDEERIIGVESYLTTEEMLSC